MNLSEALKDVKRFSRDEDHDDTELSATDGLELDSIDLDPVGSDEPPPGSIDDIGSGDDLADEELPDDNFPEEGDDKLDHVAQQATEDPDKQGLIRTVSKAHLVYKRETENGTYEELWTYNIDSFKDGLKVRQSILSGTDIPVNNSSSPDGSQSYKVWAAGNAELLHITGLVE